MKLPRATRLSLTTALSFTVMLAAAPFCRAASPTWQDKVNQIIGWEGETMPDGVLRFTLVPQLVVRVDGRPVLPNLTLDGYAAFHAEGSEALLAAEVVTLETRAHIVVDAATAAGLKVTAEHNHLLRESPKVMFIHLTGLGNPTALAQALRTVLAAAHLPLSTDEDQQDADDTAPGLNQAALEGILKSTGKPVDGVLEFSFERPEEFSLSGHSFPASMGAESEVHFESVGGGRAIEVAEIALLPAEVPKALKVLHAEQGQHFYITALHNHFLTEEPRLFFLHTWGISDPQSLSRLIRHVLDQTPQ